MRYLPDLALLLAGYFLLLKRFRRSSPLLVYTLFYFYLSAVVLLTLSPVLGALPHLFDHPYQPMHMQPFNDLIQHYGDAERQIVLNILLFVPMGFFLPVVKKQGFFAAAIKVLCISLLIELLQPLLHGSRSSDITDVITNTSGGILGYCLYLLFWRTAERKNDQKRE